MILYLLMQSTFCTVHLFCHIWVTVYMSNIKPLFTSQKRAVRIIYKVNNHQGNMPKLFIKQGLIQPKHLVGLQTLWVMSIARCFTEVSLCLVPRTWTIEGNWNRDTINHLLPSISTSLSSNTEYLEIVVKPDTYFYSRP